MKKNSKQFGKKTAFTIVELLTVMAIIAILIGLLVPSLRAVRLQAKKIKQKSQFHAIEIALETYRSHSGSEEQLTAGDFPESNWYDGQGLSVGAAYNGALKLAEAMLGQDLLGQHVESVFRVDGRDYQDTKDLYITATLDERRDIYLKLENANAYKMSDIYALADLTAINSEWPERYVLCDVFGRGNRADKIGMPILFYRAHTEKRLHDPNDRTDSTPPYSSNIYNYWDNLALLDLGIPGSTEIHPLADTTGNIGDIRFYDQTQNKKIEVREWPYNADSFILLSAGPDGKYGTPDDIHNFSY